MIFERTSGLRPDSLSKEDIHKEITSASHNHEFVCFLEQKQNKLKKKIVDKIVFLYNHSQNCTRKKNCLEFNRTQVEDMDS